MTTVDALVQQRAPAARPARCRCCAYGRRGGRHAARTTTSSRSGAVDPAAAAATLAGQGLGRPSRSLRARRGTLPARARQPRPPRSPSPRCAATTCAPAAGWCTSSRCGPATVVDGGAEGVAALAAFGALPARPAAPLRGRPLGRRAAPRGRRRRRPSSSATPTAAGASCPSSPSRTSARRSAPADPLNDNWALIDPFPDKGTDAQTVAVLQGREATSRRPRQGGLLEFPEHTPSPPSTATRAPCGPPTATCQAADRWIEIGFDRPARRALRRPAADPRPLRHRARGRRQRGPRQARPRDHAGPARPARRPPRPRDHHEGRPAARRPARLGRLPRDPDPGRAGARGCCARRSSPAARWPGATCRRTGPDLPLRARHGRRPVPAATSRIGSPLLERPQDRAGPRAGHRPRAVRARRRAATRSTPACRPPPTRPTPRSTASSACAAARRSTSSDRFGGTAGPRAPRARSTGGRDTAWIGLWAPAVGRVALDRVVARRGPDALAPAPAPRAEPGAPPDASCASRGPAAGPAAAARRRRRHGHPPAAGPRPRLPRHGPAGARSRPGSRPSARRARGGHRRRRGAGPRPGRGAAHRALRAACGSITADVGGRAGRAAARGHRGRPVGRAAAAGERLRRRGHA